MNNTASHSRNAADNVIQMSRKQNYSQLYDADNCGFFCHGAFM
jgi:hypothetical protein